MSQDTLMNTLDFTTQDLVANHQGMLSPAQREWLSHQRPSWWTPQAISAVLSSGTALTVLGATVIGKVAFLLGLPMAGFGLGMTLYLGATAWTMHRSLVHRWRRIEDDLRAGSVGVANGRAYLYLHTNRVGLEHYSLRIQGKKFDLQRRAFFAFQDCKRYRVYFAPQSRLLLSAEMLTNGEERVIPGVESTHIRRSRARRFDEGIE
jgi:hypothetical protein